MGRTDSADTADIDADDIVLQRWLIVSAANWAHHLKKSFAATASWRIVVGLTVLDRSAR